MFYRNKRILITGGLGFIGSNLAKYLTDIGAHVSIIDNLIPEFGGNMHNLDGYHDKIEVVIGDVRDKQLMHSLIDKKDILFNLAGQTSHLDSMLYPEIDLDINTVAQLSIVEACRVSNPEIRIVFASTRQIYGKPVYLPVDENHPINPVDVNGINKLAGEWYHLLYNKVYGIKTCVLRLTNTFGPGMRIKDARQTFLGVWIKNIIEGKPIQVFGDGLQLRDFNYIDDCLSALLLAGERDEAAGKLFNLGSHEVTNLKEVAEMMIRVYGRGKYNIIPFPEDRKAIDIGDYYSNYDLIGNVLQWQPKTSLKEGIAKTLAYYDKNITHYI